METRLSTYKGDTEKVGKTGVLHAQAREKTFSQRPAAVAHAPCGGRACAVWLACENKIALMFLLS